MEEMLKLLKESSPILVLLAILAYFAKIFIEKRLEGFAGRVEEIAKTSLDVKKELRSEERSELVALRVAVEKWEYFLQTAVGDFAMLDPAKAEVATLYKKDKKLFLEVRLAIVRVATYLRNKVLEDQLMGAILKIRNVYYPLINEAIPKLIDLQAQIGLIENKLKAFQLSGMKDMAYAPTEEDRQQNLKLQTLLTAEVAKFSQAFLGQYRSIAEQMVALKEDINFYVYRPISGTGINKE
ncbi:MAG: hypothetical protein PHX83_08875 [Acidobacteriia bacterium]|nr:hypothetical protein [Terriglobia bacterium]